MMKRLGAAILCIIMICAAFSAHAAEDNRVFVYRDGIHYWHFSGHYLEYNVQPNSVSVTNINMPRLIEGKTETTWPAYCVDVETETVFDTTYERVNLEDGTYYSHQQARMIRSVLNNGYWPPETPTEDYALLSNMERCINAWLAKEYAGEAIMPQVNNLTGAEAMTATQGAIWHFSNSAVFKETKNIYWLTAPFSTVSPEEIFDAVTVKPLEYENTDKHRNNINYTYEYLINLPETDPSTVIWSFTGEQVILSRKWVRNGEDANATGGSMGWTDVLESLLEGNFSQLLEKLWKEPDWEKEDPSKGDFYYQTMVRFKLKGTQEGLKNLKLYATLYDGEDANAKVLQTKTYNIGKAYDTDAVLTPDRDGYYTATFNFFAREELSNNPYVRLNLVGTQEIERDVYIYVPGDLPEDRDVSQSMVGFSGGMTNIDVNSNVRFSLSSMQLFGSKYVDGLEPDASFQFALTDVTDPENPKLVSTTWNRDGSRFSFPAVQYTKPGTYLYQVTEVQADGLLALDESVYDVKVLVEEDEDGDLVVRCPVITKDGKSVSCITFNNSRESSLTVKKAWDLSRFKNPRDGEALIPEKITVALYEEDEEIDRVELTEAMDWSYTWNDLNAQKHYTVREVDGNGRFLCTTDQAYNVFILTNTVLNTGTQPGTGDDSSLLLWAALIVLSSTAWCVTRRRHIRQ